MPVRPRGLMGALPAAENCIGPSYDSRVDQSIAGFAGSGGSAHPLLPLPLSLVLSLAKTTLCVNSTASYCEARSSQGTCLSSTSARTGYAGCWDRAFTWTDLKAFFALSPAGSRSSSSSERASSFTTHFLGASCCFTAASCTAATPVAISR